MKQTNYIGNKFFRTYLGGSKKKENKIFLEVQGISDGTLNCNWFEYRRILVDYFKDYTNVLFSWYNLFEKASYVLMGLAVLMLLTPIIPSILLVSGLVFYIVSRFLKKRLLFVLRGYDMSETLVLREIEKYSGLRLDKTTL